MSPTAPTFPAGTAVGFSYEFGVDINLGTEGSPNWQTIRRISDVAPGVKPISKDMSSYDDFGAPNDSKLSEEWDLKFAVLVNRLSSGAYAPEIEALKAYTEPDAVGELSVAQVRWYDKPVVGTPNPGEAYSGFATVTIDRGATANADVGNWKISLTGKGKRTKLATNPFTGWAAAVPTIASVLPSGLTVGDQVRIDGTGFLGTVSMTIDTVAVTEYVIVSGSTIIAVIPATVAGSAPVIVTNATGASSPHAYTAA